MVEGRYEREAQVGEGTYGRVWRARCVRGPNAGATVALKKLSLDEEKQREAGFPITAIREIEILSQMQHENVVRLFEVATSKPVGSNSHLGSVYMVFEYMEHDLGGLLDLPGFSLSLAQIKCVMRQILAGVGYCHRLGVMHRDMKASNILMNNRGELKLADFGLSRRMDEDANAGMTGRVITLWTRPPELLLGDKRYSYSVDMWSVGCIFAQLLLGKPLLRGKDEDGQMRAIMEMCGTPREDDWPGCSDLKWFKHFTEGEQGPYRRRLREHLQAKIPHLSEAGLDLVDRLLALNPSRRLTAAQALEHPFFRETPVACEKWALPQLASNSHELAVKTKLKADMAAGNKVRGYKGLQQEPEPEYKRPRYTEPPLPGVGARVPGALPAHPALPAGYAPGPSGLGPGPQAWAEAQGVKGPPLPGVVPAPPQAAPPGMAAGIAANRALLGSVRPPPPLPVGRGGYGGYQDAGRRANDRGLPGHQPPLPPRGGPAHQPPLPPGQQPGGLQPPLPPGQPPPGPGPRPLPKGPPNPYGGYRGQ